MKIVRFDAVGGASGDMILGALMGLGVDREELQSALRSLNVGEFELQLRPFQSHGISGVQAAVRITGDARSHHHHEHPHAHAHAHSTAHDHRGLAEITDIINGSRLPEAVKASSLQVFGRIADAEAKIHGTTRERIHFHEVGAVDSIVDIVGCCLGLHLLGVERILVSPLPMGHGVIECAHGTYPSPAPATVELLAGARVVDVDEPFELVTPTGAALLTTWPRAESAAGNVRVLGSANSFGHRRLNGRPNLLRAVLMESSQTESAPNECLVLECNLDDTTAELIGSLTERLMAVGALDAFTTPIQMKKQRPAAMVSVLCEPARREELLDLIFRESTTLGVREYTVRRTVLDRRWEKVDTPHGVVRVKIGRWRDEDVTLAPEMDDCIKLARERDVPVRVVYESAQQAARSRSSRAS